jgi:beta-lactamase class A
VALAAVTVLFAACGSAGDPAATTPAPAPPSPSATASAAPADLTGVVAADLAALESASEARVGVYAVDTGSGAVVTHRADERFGYASTIKALAVGAVLDGEPAAVLGTSLPVTAEDVADAGYTPVTGDRVGTEMTLADLSAAAVSESDNGALNVVLRHLGGPAALQAALVALGDTTTLVDADEPELNRFTPGDPARTSTPRALADGLAAYALGDALEPDVRTAYTGWLTGSTTGDTTIRAGAPDGWVVGGKTGSAGRYGSRNDVAVVWPPDRAPIVLAVLTDRPAVDAEPDDAVLAEAARIVLGAYA